jgi:hypothetical protein
MIKTTLVVLLALPALGAVPWEKPPEKWNLADVFRILRDSPWCPAQEKLEAKAGPRQEDSRTGMVTDSDSPIDSNQTTPVPSVQVIRKPELAVPVLWWSSKTIRLAEARLQQLQSSGPAKQPLHVDDLPDYVLAIEGSEPLRILHDAKEDLHDTVFLELPDGTTLDLASTQFVDGAGDQEARAEFHFPRLVDGQPTIDPTAQYVILHCKATAKTPRPFENNTLAIRAEFKLQTMRIHGVLDL